MLFWWQAARYFPSEHISESIAHIFIADNQERNHKKRVAMRVKSFFTRSLHNADGLQSSDVGCGWYDAPNTLVTRKNNSDRLRAESHPGKKEAKPGAKTQNSAVKNRSSTASRGRPVHRKPKSKT